MRSKKLLPYSLRLKVLSRPLVLCMCTRELLKASVDAKIAVQDRSHLVLGVPASGRLFSTHGSSSAKAPSNHSSIFIPADCATLHFNFHPAPPHPHGFSSLDVTSKGIHRPRLASFERCSHRRR